ncbi:MAG: GspH/FimT family pseudopilin [Methylovulum sp.]|nr:GspH/FimT family pseudopilin [Methylovulum sp.]
MIKSTRFMARQTSYGWQKNKRLAGFGLVELMITLVIASIVLGLAMPTFTKVIGSTRLTAYTNDFVSSLMLAKSEAVKRGVRVSVLSKSGTPGSWEAGWDVFTDPNATGGFNASTVTLCLPGEECLIRTYGGLPTGYTFNTFAGAGSPNDMLISYGPSGQSIIPAGVVTPGDTFVLCDGSHDNTQSRVIVLNALGRTRVSEGTGSCP